MPSSSLWPDLAERQKLITKLLGWLRAPRALNLAAFLHELNRWEGYQTAVWRKDPSAHWCYLAGSAHNHAHTVTYPMAHEDGFEWGALRVAHSQDLPGELHDWFEQIALALSVQLAPTNHLLLEGAEGLRFNIENSIIEGIAIVSLEGRLIYVNPSFCKLVGYPKEELIDAQAPFPFWPAAEAERLKGVLQAAVLGETPPQGFEVVYRRSDGEFIDVHLLVAPLRRENQRLALVSAFEITERKRAEKALQESKERFRLLTENVPGAVFRYLTFEDGSEVASYTSPRIVEIFEMPLSQGGLSYLSCLAHPDDGLLIEDLYRHVREGRSSFAVEYRIVTPSGILKWVRLVANATHQSDGSVCWDGFIEDVSARKKTEIALRESEKRYASLAAAVPVGIYRLDNTGNPFYVNGRFHTIAGFMGVPSLSQSWLERIHPDDQQRMISTWMSTAAQGGNFACEYRFLQPDGTIRWVFSQAEREKDASGNVVGWVGSLTDISAQKQIEAELEAARLQAEAASRSKSDFLAAMSHEIRTPMNGVIGMTGLLLDSELNPQQREFARTIQHSGEILLTLINDILDYSKIEAGRLELETLDFEPHRVAEEVIELMAASASAKEIELVCLVDAGIPHNVAGDPGRIRQVLLNLVSNAVKFTEPLGQVWIEVSPESGGESSPELLRARFEVRDSGVGIPLESQSKMFQPFSQADSSTTRKYGGTGLGLSICRRLVELMGGEISFSSVPGTGSRFWFTLPLYSRPSAPAPLSWTTERVLLVEHPPILVEYLSRQFSQWGLDYVVATAPEANEIISAALVQSRPFSHVLVEDGSESPGLAWWRQSRRASVHGVLTSTRSRRPAAQDLERDGFSDWLSRPLRPSQLLQVVGGSKAETEPIQTGEVAESLPETAAVRILVAEDNTTNQRVVFHLLKKIGNYTADFAATGVEVLQALDRNPDYALILMDCQMPLMDGYEATREVRRQEQETQTRRMPIIALTAGAFQEDREQCFISGMDDFLSKPVRQAELKAALERWLPPSSKDPEESVRT